MQCSRLPGPIPGQCDAVQKAPDGTSNCMLGNQVLRTNEFLRGEGANGDSRKNTRLAMQTDGNLVLYQGEGRLTCDGTGSCPIWSSTTNDAGCPSKNCKYGLYLNEEVKGEKGALSIVLEEIGDETIDQPVGTVIWNGGSSGAVIPGSGTQYPGCCSLADLCPSGHFPKNSQGIEDQTLCTDARVSRAKNWSVPSTYSKNNITGCANDATLLNTDNIKNVNWVILQADGNIVGYHNPDPNDQGSNCPVWTLSTQVVGKFRIRVE